MLELCPERRNMLLPMKRVEVMAACFRRCPVVLQREERGVVKTVMLLAGGHFAYTAASGMAQWSAAAPDCPLLMDDGFRGGEV